MSSKKLFLKYNNKTADWVGHSKLKLLDTIDFFKKKVINNLQAILTGTKIEQAAYGGGGNPDFLQEAEEQEAE